MRGQSGVNAPLLGEPVEALHDIKRPTYTASNRRVNQFETNETSLISRQQGDFVFCAASSSELPRYGVKHGLTNWTSAYATGLLCARRALKKLGLDEKSSATSYATATKVAIWYFRDAFSSANLMRT